MIQLGDTVWLTGTFEVTGEEEYGGQLVYKGWHTTADGHRAYVIVPSECVEELQPQVETVPLDIEEDERYRSRNQHG